MRNKIPATKFSPSAKVCTKSIDSVDKSVYVDTLFNDENCKFSIGDNSQRQVKPFSKVRSSKISPKVKKLKKFSNQKTNITIPLREKIESIIDIAKNSKEKIEIASFKMAIPKKIYRNCNEKPEFNNLERSKEIEEIIIDQRFKIKQNVTDVKAVKENSQPSENFNNQTKHGRTKRSIFSSPNDTLLPNLRAKNLEEKKNACAFVDQIIQTKNSEVESIGIQAFSSGKSSVCNLPISGNANIEAFKEAKNTVNTSSKNIQAFGLNSSLPKQLAQLKETNSKEDRNTKSTQFFGGPINSLPNYHSQLMGKQVESCGRVLKALKAKKNLEAEIINLCNENKKNIMANENESNPNRGCEGNAPENKENLLTEKPLKSKLPLSSSLEKGTKEVEFTTTSQDSCKNKLESNSKLKVKKESKNSPEVSDDVPCKILTSKLLKEHGDCIDRNLIQEKYFQSQLLEIEKKQMTSKSTSMETPFDQIEYNQVHDKTTATVACQYSSRLNEETSDESSKIQDLSVIGRQKLGSYL